MLWYIASVSEFSVFPANSDKEVKALDGDSKGASYLEPFPSTPLVWKMSYSSSLVKNDGAVSDGSPCELSLQVARSWAENKTWK